VSLPDRTCELGRSARRTAVGRCVGGCLSIAGQSVSTVWHCGIAEALLDVSTRYSDVRRPPGSRQNALVVFSGLLSGTFRC